MSLIVYSLKASEDTHCRGCAAVYRETGRRVTDVGYRSTKVRKMLELLRAIENQDDPGKTIIFSEFVKMLDIVAGVLKEEGMRFVRCKVLPSYAGIFVTNTLPDDGTMNAAQRQVALDAIKQDSRVKIILISTKAGNSGLFSELRML
jgi:SNF2 family DNA or RNA helicase